ncbi:MAG TPA: hypothetical protein VF440_01800 [Novosphingobium sp.]
MKIVIAAASLHREERLFASTAAPRLTDSSDNLRAAEEARAGQ